MRPRSASYMAVTVQCPPVGEVLCWPFGARSGIRALWSM